jgi:hypothetical protein
MPDVLSILKFGSKETLTFEVAPLYKDCTYSLTEKGGLTLRLKFRGRLEPLVNTNYFYIGKVGTLLSQKYLKFIFFSL